MFEAFVITLREGVEAALVFAITLTLLNRRGLSHLRGALAAGAASALVAAGLVAAAAGRLTYNQEIAEGVAMLVGAALVLALTLWMWRAAPHMSAEIESGVSRATAGTGGGAAGIFLFAFGMVFREGVETAIFLSAASFNSQGLGMWLGAAAGATLAVVFGVLFVRGAIRVPLKAFFSITTAVLLLFAVQLTIGGLHELSEGQVLPTSRAEMAIIGPIVKNELLMFTLTLALVAVWMWFGARESASSIAPLPAEGAAARLARAARSEAIVRRRWTAVVTVLILSALSVAFVRGARIPPKPAARLLVEHDGTLMLERTALADGHLHFFETTLDGSPVRFFAVEAAGAVRTCLDACEICGDIGYFEDGAQVVCRNCTSPIVTATLGASGGCNPIPLPHTLAPDRVLVRVSDLRAGFARIKDH